MWDDTAGFGYMDKPTIGTNNIIGNTTIPNIPTQSTNNTSSWFSNIFGSNNQNTNPLQWNQNLGISKEAWDVMNPMDKQKFLMNNQAINNFGQSSMLDNIGLGMAGLNTLMDMSMFGDKRDYMNASIDSIRQNQALANDAYNRKVAARDNYGSAFSNAKN
jgi:hypothetical protein